MARGALARAIALCAMVALSGHAVAQMNEYDLKAAFLFNFALFTQPAVPAKPAVSETEPYRICIFGKDPFGPAANTLTTRTIAGRPIVLRHPVATDELKRCQLVFIGEAERESVRRATSAVSGLPIITVGESKDFPATGTVFNLAVIDDKVAFQVNTQAARVQQLDVSAKLTRLAKSVH